MGTNDDMSKKKPTDVKSLLNKLLEDLYGRWDWENILRPVSTFKPSSHERAPNTSKYVREHILPRYTNSSVLGSRGGGTLTQSETTCIMLLHPDTYEYDGHVYVWPSLELPDTVDVIGIRASLFNLLQCTSTTKTVIKIFYGVWMWAKKNNFKFICIVSPLSNIIPIISGLGFSRWGGVSYRISTEKLGKELTEIYDLLYFLQIHPNDEVEEKLFGGEEQYRKSLQKTHILWLEEITNYGCEYPYQELNEIAKRNDYLRSAITVDAKNLAELWKYTIKDEPANLRKYLEELVVYGQPLRPELNVSSIRMRLERERTEREYKEELGIEE